MHPIRQSRFRRSPKTAALVILLATGSATVTFGQPIEPIAYTIRFPESQTHYAEINANVPTKGLARIELMMPVWTPGSYLVREFSRHVEGLTARAPNGRPLQVEKSRKNRWLITTGGAPRIEVSYRIYSREMSVRTNWIDVDFAMLNGAPTFLTLADDDNRRPHDVILELPQHWVGSLTGLTPRPDNGPHAYRAPDFDALVDSPIIVGNPSVYEFSTGGIRHRLVNVGESGTWDGPRSATDVQKITEEMHRLWRDVPYDQYLFLNMITEAGGGLEHRNSALLMSSRWDTEAPRSYQRWLSLVSHELFHAWNVKKLRPTELGPFDYENEVYTRSLWIVEGITSYYDDLIVRRAELSTTEDYLDALSGQIRTLQRTPGRSVQPVALASYDAWIKYYRADENSANTSVSYYTKGAVVALLLDMRIRVATGGLKSLDDVMRLAYARFSGERGYTPEDFRETAAEVAGIDLSAWFTLALDSTAELDYTEALDWLGLEFSDPAAEEEERGWVGLLTRATDGRLVVAQVQRDTPAFTAGFNVDDEILAIGDHRVLPDAWSERVARAAPGSTLSVLVSRRGGLRRLSVEVAADPTFRWDLVPLEEPSVAQEQQREAWLTGQ